MANCQDTLDKLYVFLDRELDPAERREVETHLSMCPPCRDVFRIEYNVLRVVGEKCRETEAPATLVERVKKLCGGSETPSTS
jgi:mycothiol system anti-sigma-R factor